MKLWCAHCGEEFYARQRLKYCSRVCRAAGYKNNGGRRKKAAEPAREPENKPSVEELLDSIFGGQRK